MLKNVTVGNATKLSRVSFTQCKKLDEISMVRQIGIIRSQRNRVIFLRPMNHVKYFYFFLKLIFSNFFRITLKINC